MRKSRRHRPIRAWLAAMLVLAAAGTAASASARAPHEAFVGGTIEQPQALPDFALRDQNGRLVELGRQRGKLVLLTFLYTHCPDVCPLTAQNLNLAVHSLGPAGRDVRVLAVSVDPAGDTPKSVRKFVRDHRLSSRFHYLTGTAAQLSPILHAYNVTAVRHPGDDVDHTLYVLLVDRAGKGRVIFDATARPAAVAHDLRLLLR
jgi:protein SCO1/2